MSYNKKSLTFEEQLDLLISRGIKVNNRPVALIRLKNLSYYKIKEFLVPYEKKVIDDDGNVVINYDENQNKIINYRNITFEKVIRRFYQDKNLRLYLLHAIEKIELSLKTQFAYVLGKRDGFSYLKFNMWCNKEEFCKHYILFKQQEFHRTLKEMLRRSKNSSIIEFLKEEEEKIPPIWMVVDVLTLGNIVHLFTLMSKKKKEEIAKFYKCEPEEFESWLKHIKFIRNKCAHNSNIIDLKMKTRPLLRKEWREKLFVYEHKNNLIYTNRIANTFMIVSYLVKNINLDYRFGDIHKNLTKIISHNDVIAHDLGFKDKNTINFLFN